MRSAPNLSFEPRRSRLALVLTLLIGLLAAGAVYASGMPVGPKIGLAAFIAIALALAVRTLAATSLPRCTRQAEGRWSIAFAGSEQSATLERSHDLGFLIALQELLVRWSLRPLGQVAAEARDRGEGHRRSRAG